MTTEALRAIPANSLVSAPILPTMVRLATPNIVALLAVSLVAVAETSYIGILGTAPLAAMALVFPMVMLTQMMSSGAMGGGVSSAIARALGAGDDARARALAVHAIVIGVLAGLAFTLFFLTLGPEVYALLGGRDSVHAEAVAYSNALFTGVVVIWLCNTLASIVRGTGNMRVPSATMMSVAAAQVLIGGVLALGAGAVPRLGIRGVALGQVFAFTAGAVFLLWYLRAGPSRLRLGFASVSLDWGMFRDILRVGAIACLSPLQSILTVIVLAHFAANYGVEALAGFGIGVRLELLLVPVAFAIGVACVPMVGMAIGAGAIARARRVAWVGASLSALLIGSVGILVGFAPDLWGSLFTDNAGVRAAVVAYLSVTGLGFPAYGFGLCLYFAAQGSGRIVGPVLAGTLRLAVVAGGGAWLVASGAPFGALAQLVMVAMLAYGAATALAVWRTRWGRD